MSETIALKVKTKSGSVSTIDVLELIEVDGRPWKTADDYQELRDAVAHLTGRVDTIENLIRPGGN